MTGKVSQALGKVWDLSGHNIVYINNQTSMFSVHKTRVADGSPLKYRIQGSILRMTSWSGLWLGPFVNVSNICLGDMNSSGVSTRYFWSRYEKHCHERSNSIREMPQVLIKNSYSPCRGLVFESQNLLEVKKKKKNL